MAVQKNRKTRAKRDKRRTHDGIKGPTLSVDPLTGETHLRHHMTPDGYYRGKKIMPEKAGTEEGGAESNVD